MDTKTAIKIIDVDLKTVTKEELKEKFRFKSRFYHPDKGGTVEDFQMLQDAYQSIYRYIRDGKSNYSCVEKVEKEYNGPIKVKKTKLEPLSKIDEVVIPKYFEVDEKTKNILPSQFNKVFDNNFIETKFTKGYSKDELEIIHHDKITKDDSINEKNLNEVFLKKIKSTNNELVKIKEPQIVKKKKEKGFPLNENDYEHTIYGAADYKKAYTVHNIFSHIE